jgi:hypothetical protein
MAERMIVPRHLMQQKSWQQTNNAFSYLFPRDRDEVWAGLWPRQEEDDDDAMVYL